MGSRLRDRRPSPALVVAVLALFVALGGTVWAASRIDGRTIKPKSLPGNRVIAGTLPLNRLAPGAIGGNRVDSRTLGQVPSAAHADTAGTARTAGNAIHAQGADDADTVNGYPAGCGAGTRLFAGACWETRTQPAALDANAAAAACGHEGGELPRALALKAFGELEGIVLEAEGEWTGEIIGYTSPDTYAVGLIKTGGGLTITPHTDHRYFRCVIPLLH